MSYKIYSDEYFMNEALKEAYKAGEEQEIPVGAVIVADQRIIARAHNMTQTLNHATAHAEMLATVLGPNTSMNVFCSLHWNPASCALQHPTGASWAGLFMERAILRQDLGGSYRIFSIQKQRSNQAYLRRSAPDCLRNSLKTKGSKSGKRDNRRGKEIPGREAREEELY